MNYGLLIFIILQTISMLIARMWFDSYLAIILIGTLITLLIIPALMIVINVLFAGVIGTSMLIGLGRRKS